VNDLQLLDGFVAPFDGEPGDWPDVLRRATRRRPRRRFVLAAAAIVAALAAASAVAVPLLRSDGPKLPAAADRRNVLAVIQPRTGRVLIEAAPWKGRDGVCFLIVGKSARCVPRSKRASAVVWSAGYMTPSGRNSAVWGYTFDRRVAAVKIYAGHRKYRAVPVHRFEGRLRVTFIGPVPFTRLVGRPPDGAAPVRFYDRAGRRITG
jgi:hypothetical protein